MSYDKKCYALADSFMSDYPHLRDRDERTAKLAQHIQTTIEDWLCDWEAEDVADIQDARDAYEDEKRERRIEDEMEARRVKAVNS